MGEKKVRVIKPIVSKVETFKSSLYFIPKKITIKNKMVDKIEVPAHEKIKTVASPIPPCPSPGPLSGCLFCCTWVTA